MFRMIYLNIITGVLHYAALQRRLCKGPIKRESSYSGLMKPLYREDFAQKEGASFTYIHTLQSFFIDIGMFHKAPIHEAPGSCTYRGGSAKPLWKFHEAQRGFVKLLGALVGLHKLSTYLMSHNTAF